MSRSPISGASTHTNGKDAGSPTTLSELALWPTLAFFYLFALLQLGGIDDWIMQRFYDPAAKAFPLKNDFWTSTVMHTGGRRLMIAVALVVVATWLLSLRVSRLHEWRRLLGYLLICVLMSVAVVNLGKRVTNVDCPWDLAGYGGTRPYFGLLRDKPRDLSIGHCFPGGHSSGGFAWFGLFFIGRRRGYRPVWLLLTPAATVGTVFAVDQWIRGAHFPSHDLTTAYVCWMIALAIYAWMFRRHEQRTEPDWSPTAASENGSK